MKTHLNLRVRDLEKSVSFYRTLLEVEPIKQFDDYALFITEEPGLELALDADRSLRLAESAHYGVVVDSPDVVDAAIARLKAANLPADVELEETCCYALQTKVWTADPDGRRWEVYTVLKETEQRDDCGTACCSR
jgi:catechol 2,3-dioxygenase-like lactoylglutathione lyase family enzyme